MVAVINLNKYRSFLETQRFRKKELEDLVFEVEEQLLEVVDRLQHLVDLRDILGVVGTLAKDRVKGVIESLVTSALKAVFDDGYSFEIENKIQRDKSETVMYVVIDGERNSLKDELGGGVIDLVSFVLRVVMWSISSPRSSNTIILDEPGKFLSKDKLDLFGTLIKRLSDMLGIQFIIVTHENSLIDAADASYAVVQDNGVSSVEKVV